jgi:hypothetical protein
MKLFISKLLREGLNEVDWEGDFSDVKHSCVSPKQLVKDLNAELERLDTPEKSRKKRGQNKVIYTRGNIEKIRDKNGELDVNKFKALITAMPPKIFDQNPKMEKTDDGGAQLTVNTGIPAISGIIWDSSASEFHHINTCPGAGACRTVCYARKGFYGMNDGKSLKLIQRLNLLMNDPEEYYNMMMDELEPLAMKLKRQGRRAGQDIKLVIRWNDAGDFFTDTYYKLAVRATNDLLEAGYNVKSYAYTKVGKYVELSNPTFIMNFSKGANKRELDSVDLERAKYSEIVPREIFSHYFERKGPHYAKDEHGKPKFIGNGKEELRANIAAKYNIPKDTLLYQDELPQEEGEQLQYNSIVLPTGDSDISAQREDVKITFLCVH